MKRCRNCSRKFEPGNSLQVVCSTFCGIQYGKTDAGKKAVEKAQRAELRDFRKRSESLGALTKKAQTAFNSYIRARDAGLPCISCGAPDGPVKFGGSRDCGHYRSTGACPQLRFTPINAAGQCSRCNGALSGNVVEFRKGLLARIGPAQLAWVESDHELPRWRREDLIEIRKRFARMARVEKENAA